MLDEADRFFQLENFDASAKEYQRFLFFAPEHPSAYYAHFRLGLAEQQLGRQVKAQQAFRQAARFAPSARDREYISYRLALTYLRAHELDRAKVELLRLTVGSQDSILATQASVLAGVAFAYQQRWEQAREMFQRASTLQEGNPGFRQAMGEAVALTESLEGDLTPRSPSLAKWMSTFLPGSGQAYAGRVGRGTTTLAVNAGTSYLVYRSIATESYVDAGLLVTLLWWRYYQGNRVRAAEAADEVNREYQQRLESQLYAALEEAGQFLPSQEYSPSRQRAERQF